MGTNFFNTLSAQKKIVQPAHALGTSPKMCPSIFGGISSWSVEVGVAGIPLRLAVKAYPCLVGLVGWVGSS